MHPAIQAFGGLRVDMALAHQAAESGLDMRTGAAEPVVKVEVPEGGVEIVPPQQADYPAAEPDALRIAGRPGEHTRRFGNFVDAFLAFLGGVDALFRLFGRFGGPDCANAALAVMLKTATQNAVRNRRNKETVGIVPSVLMEATRPLSDRVCDRIGTRMRRFKPAAPAMLT